MEKKTVTTTNWLNLILGAIIGIGGCAFLWSADWHLALGMLLMIWGNNLQRTP